MKKFKNRWAVTGPVSLRKAFRDECLKLGYRWYGRWDDFELFPILVNGWNGAVEVISNCHNTHTRYRSAVAKFSLPADWDEALAYASEEEAVDPWEGVEYARCIDPRKSRRFALGRVYRLKGPVEGRLVTVTYDDEGKNNKFSATFFEPATQGEYVQWIHEECVRRFGEIKAGDVFNRDGFNVFTRPGKAKEGWGRASRYFEVTDRFFISGVCVYEQGKFAEKVVPEPVANFPKGGPEELPKEKACGFVHATGDFVAAATQAAFEYAELKANDLKELKEEQALLESLLALARNEEYAIKLTVFGPGKNKLKYWVDDNSNVVRLVEAELKGIKNQIKSK